MPLLISGDHTFQQSGPLEWHYSLWDLDQLTVPWQGGIDLLDAFLNSHVVGEVSPDDENMYLVQIIPDGHKQFPTVQLIYQGRKGGILPPQQHDYDDTVASASSKKDNGIVLLTQPLVLEFYAPTSTLSYISANAPGTDVAADPVGDPKLITLTSFDTTFNITPPLDTVIQRFFSIQIISTMKQTELVPNKYWKNVSRKMKHYTPFIFTIPTGPLISLYSPGSGGYRIDDRLYFHDPTDLAENGSVRVTSVFVAFGTPEEAGVYSWEVLTSYFTRSHNGLMASGGNGVGAGFNVTVF